jgi:NADH dehydrogenase/NADH:ubiquinone oxidoreductase subunit G
MENNNPATLVEVTIDGRTVSVPDDFTVLQAALEAGVEIPTLCYLKEINQIGACRICLVEIERARGLQPACVYPVNQGMVVHTNNELIRSTRRAVLELILSNHPMECLTCTRNKSCELQALADQFGVRDIPYQGANPAARVDTASPSIERNSEKCVLCKRCVSVCQQVQQIAALGINNRGLESYVGQTLMHWPHMMQSTSSR